jgi:nitrogen fixation/metabolism regulation signal transduction histidine kinase
MNLKQFQLVFLILGCIFATLLAIYATVMLGITAAEQAKPLNIVIGRN